MSGWMETILVASRDAGILVLAIGLVIKLSGRRMPARFCHAAWLLVAVRLLMPVIPASPFSLQRILTVTESSLPVKVSEIQPTPLTNDNGASPRDTSPPVYPIRVEGYPEVPSGEKQHSQISPSASIDPWDIAAGVWISGALGLLILGAGMTLRFRRRVQRLTRSHPKAGDLEIALVKIGHEFGWKKLPLPQITEAVESPALFGLFKPRILMPPSLLDDLSDSDLRLVLLHELGHWKRRDIPVNFALALAQAIHWFNPLVWWAFHRARLESERATDDLVLQRTGAEHSTDYGEMLLRLLARRARPSAKFSGMVSVVENPGDLRQRMTAIGRFTGKRHVLAAVMSLAVLIGLAAVGLTQAPPSGNEAEATITAANTSEVSDKGFSCHVVSAEGVPVEGADIFVSLNRLSDDEPIDSADFEGNTDSEGKFSPTIPEVFLTAKDVDYTFVARHPDHGVGAAGRISRSGIPSKTLKLSKVFPLRLKVSDEDGNPVPNLELHVAAAKIPDVDSEDTKFDFENFEFWGDAPDLPQGLWRATTDREGRCVIKDLPAGRYYVDHSDPKYAQFPGRLDYRFQHLAGPDDLEISLKVEPAATVSGKVTFPDGSPVPGMKVKILEHYNYLRGGCSNEAVTNSKGEYILERLLPSIFDVKVLPEGQLAQAWAYEITPIELGKGEQKANVNFTLQAGAVVKGRVTLSDTGAPVPDYWVGITLSRAPSPLHNEGTRTNADGYYSSNRVSAGEKNVYPGGSGPAGYTTRNIDKSELGKALKVENGGVYETDFKLLRESSVSGIVVDELGKPVQGADVFCLKPLDRMSDPLEAKSDDQGRFTFMLPAGTTNAEIIATFKESLSETQKEFPVGEEARLVMKAISFASVTGRVVDDGGDAIKGAVVGWYGKQIKGIKYQAISDDDGRFEFDKVLPGKSISFNASKKGFGTGLRQATLKAGDKVNLDDIVLAIADASVAGKIVDSTGKAVPLAVVRVGGYRQPEMENFITDESGKFSFEGLVEGWVDVDVFERKRFSKARLRTGKSDNIVTLGEENQESKRQKIVDFVGKPAPSLKAEHWLNSGSLPENQLGKVRFISFVGMDRPLIFFPDELPNLQKFRDANLDKELEIILVHGAWPKEEILEILAADYPDFKLPLAIEPKKDAMSEKLGVRSWLYVVIDQKNNVVFQSMGDFAGARKKALSLLKKKD